MLFYIMYRIFRGRDRTSGTGLKASIKVTCKERKGVFCGFTLIELIVILAIVGILSGVAVPAYQKYIDKARMIKATMDIQILEKEILVYIKANRRLPDSLDDTNRGDFEDPWGNPYQYLNIETAKRGEMRKDRMTVPINSDFDLYSKGEDGESQPPLTAKASHDDIIRASNGAYIGIASAY